MSDPALNSDSDHRLPYGLSAQLQALVGGPIRRRLAQWSLLVPRINALEPILEPESDDQLRKRSLSLQYRAKSGEPLSRLIVEAYALVREAARRTLRMRHFDVQLVGGIALFHSSIAEMETGEGKTLTASLPLYVRALMGKGAQLATVNDYLAERDAELMRPLFRLLGMSVGVIQTDMNQPARRRAYECDITYGTAKEFGFDFLRDRLLLRRQAEMGGGSLAAVLGNSGSAGGEQPVQRAPYFALVDEADSVLIDEARTPLIISAIPQESAQRAVECYKWAAEAMRSFVEDEHYTYDHEKRSVELNAAGRQQVRTLPKDSALDPVGLVDLYEYVERAIKVDREFHRDRQFVIRDGEVVIVDESTGRLAEGRKWRSGIHQAVEAKEGVEITVDSGQAARVTIQDFFLRYPHLAGMTGTAASSAREMRKIYHLPVVPIPTNRPARRRRLPDCTYPTNAQKWASIAEEVARLHAAGQPVLIGTRTIEKSQLLSELFRQAGIPHQVLNAHQIAAEAEIVAQAGQMGNVTVSTNMAGRGTDIKLGAGVPELGGLRVICTELHDSARIDRQLAGRCGRQGDPGEVQQYMSMEDDILEAGYGPKKAAKLREQCQGTQGELRNYAGVFHQAQRLVERQHFRQRMMLMHHEKNLKKMHREMGQDPYLDISH